MTVVAILVNVLMIALIAFVAWRKTGTSDSQVFWSAAAARLGAGICVGLFYLYYYKGEGDTFTLFNSAVDFAGSDAIMISEPRSLFLIYILSLVNKITLNNYWVTSMWFSLFSFICSYRLFSKVVQLYPSARIASVISLLFLPSVVFWSSGVMKETVAFGAVAILSMYFVLYLNDRKPDWKGFIEIILALFLLLSLKYYWAAVLLPSMATAIIVKKINPSKYLVGWYISVFLLLSIAASFTHPNFHPDRFLQVLVENHDIYVLRQPHNLIEYNYLSPTWISLLQNSPLALWSGLFRPTVFEINSFPEALAAIENLVILLLFAWKLTMIKRPKPGNRLVVLTVIVFSLVLCIFLALSTPNLGTLSRYRVGFLSFFVLLILADHPILKFIHGKSSNHIRS